MYPGAAEFGFTAGRQPMDAIEASRTNALHRCFVIASIDVEKVAPVHRACSEKWWTRKFGQWWQG